MVHQRAFLWEKAKHVTMPAHVDELLNKLQNLEFRLAHADNNVSTELLWPENVTRIKQDFPVFLPSVRALYAFAARTIKDLRCRGINCDGEDIRAHLVQELDVFACHCRRVGENGNWNSCRVDPVGPLLQDGDRIFVRTRMCDHRNAHPMERCLVGAREVQDNSVTVSAQPATRQSLYPA